MSHSRTLRFCCCLVAALVLALGASSAVAGAGLRYSPGPTTVHLASLAYYQVNAELFNTGDTPDRYHLTVTKNIPEDWTLSVCFGGICYPPQLVEFMVPADEALAAGASTLVDLDITKMFTLGTGSFTVSIVSENNPSLVDQVVYTVYDPATDPIAFDFATGATIMAGELNEVSHFRTAIFNYGTQDDAYLVTVTRNHPATWSSTICYDGICYPPTESSFRIPAVGYLPGGSTTDSATDIDIDFSPMVDAGAGSMLIQVRSEANNQIVGERMFYVSTDGLIAVGEAAPGAMLSQVQAAPNPFNPRTEIRFLVGGEQTRLARVSIFDMRGRQVRTLDLGEVAPGAHDAVWDGRDGAGAMLGAGVYLARVQVGDQSQNVKLSLVK